ncbi:MAG TPA: SAF domain-containing protein, partial [Stellaceae bacterium]|nr:SAF domain-containing protein [Stellaceae bacterium]
MPPLAIRLKPSDTVLVARVDLTPGTVLAPEGVRCRDTIPAGHKVAIAPIA